MHVTRRLPILFALVLILAGCGGGTPAATDAGGEVGADATPTAATDGGDVAATAPPAGGGNGSSIDDFCLVTADEVSAAFEVEGVEATSFENPGLGGGCRYVDVDGGNVFGLAVISTGGIPAFDAGTGADSGAEAVSGIGDDAFYVPAGEFFGFLFRKGDVVVNIGPTSFTMLDGDLARLRAATEELALMAAGRL